MYLFKMTKNYYIMIYCFLRLLNFYGPIVIVDIFVEN